MTRFLLRAVLAVIFGASLGAGRLSAAEYLIDRDKVEITPGVEPTATFTVRLTDIGGVTKAEAKVGEKAVPVEKINVPAAKTQVYFLLDLSASEPLLKAERDTFKQVIDGLSPTEFEVGLGTVGPTLTHWFSSLPEKVARDATLKSLGEKKHEARAEIFRSTREALERLKSQPGDSDLRKVIVLLTPGKADDRDARGALDSLIADCVKDGVLICAISYARSPAEVDSSHDLERLTKETGGFFIGTEPPSNRPQHDFVLQLRGQLRSMARLSVSLKDVPPGLQNMSVKLTLLDLRTFQFDRKIDVPAGGAPAASVDTPKAETPAATPSTASSPAAVTSATAAPMRAAPAGSHNLLYLVAAGVLLLGALGWIILRIVGKSQRPPDVLWQAGAGAPPVADALPAWAPAPAGSEIDELPTMPEGGDMLGRSISSGGAQTQYLLGWLEEIDNGGVRGTRHPISKSTLTLGRSSDSDLQLKHDSISVHHATVHRKSDGEIAIDDLQTLNGVYVNGKRVEHSILKDGDIIELGAIRLRLVLNPNGETR